MAKGKKQDDAPKGCPAWLATYGDMVTLVLTFFVLLFAMSNLDEEKLMEFASYFTGAEQTIIDFMGSTSIMEMMGNGIVEYPIPSSIMEALNEIEEPPTNLYEYIDKLENTISEYETYFSESTGSGEYDVSITIEDQRIIIVLGEGTDVLFDSGEAVVKSEIHETLDKIADLILQYPNSNVIVEGHTDNVPMRGRYQDNWELSTARANSVLRYLIDKTGLEGKLFKSSGMGEFMPIGDNSTPEGRKQNRRVVIYIEMDAAARIN